MDWNALFRNTALEILKSLPPLMWEFRYILLFLAGIQGLKLVFRFFQYRRLLASGIYEIDRMDGRTFEQYLAALFMQLGHEVELTQYVGDYGADLVTRKDGVRTVVQAKRYRGKVGVKAIQEAVAAKGYYRCAEAMVVTNSTFTNQAVALAKANGVTLWDRERLIKALLATRPQRKEEAAAPTAADATATVPASESATSEAPRNTSGPKCATCGQPVSEKVREYCEARPGRFGGDVFCYEHQRAARKRTPSGSPG
jgi:restriction system protein